MRILLVIGLGGFIGAVLRYGVGGLTQEASRTSGFPVGTLVVNLLGCLLIGALAWWMEARAAFSPDVRAFLFVGVLGALTTFSSFGLETFNLLRDGQMGRALASLVLNNGLGLALVWLGHRVSGWWWG